MIQLDIIREAAPDVAEAMLNELLRQRRNIELIASENFVSPAVMAAMGSHLTNKYAEGYPDKRYYGGCEYVDVVENIARDRACQLFGAEHANVQPNGGSSANFAVYFALLQPGDKVLGMDLSHGGHLTHGSPVNMSGQYYTFYSYGLDPETECIDYDEVRKKALDIRPKLIIAGASAYPRKIDYKKFREIADEAGALLMVDMAHIAGLAAAGLHMNPVPYADVVTTTTHKTLRGPRGGMILCKKEFANAIDKAIFPGTQGGTDNHLLLLDLGSDGLTGKEVEQLLDRANITVNKNSVPNETRKPAVTSGIRVGTPAATTRGLDEDDFVIVGRLIADIIKNGEEAVERVAAKVREITDKYPLYPGE